MVAVDTKGGKKVGASALSFLGHWEQSAANERIPILADANRHHLHRAKPSQRYHLAEKRLDLLVQAYD